MSPYLQRLRSFAPTGAAVGAAVVLWGLGEGTYVILGGGFMLAAASLLLATSPDH